METSRYFERTLFYDQNPAAYEYYSRSVGFIFEADARRSQLEVRIQSTIDASYYDRKQDNSRIKSISEDKDETPVASDPNNVGSTSERPKFLIPLDDASLKARHFEDADADYKDPNFESNDAWSLSSRASSTALSAALDQHQGSLPPTYPGRPKLVVVNLDTDNIQSFVERTRSDFRVFYVRQRHSYSRLQITKELFEQLLRGCRVFPRFNEYLIGFGVKHSNTEVGPPPLRFRALSTSRNNKSHGFECAYILRYVEFTNRGGGKDPWSLRQFAVYHRFKPKSATGCSTWILVGASERTEVRLDRYTRSIDDLTGSNPFELHVIFLDTAIASWRHYLIDLTRLVTHQSDKALGILVCSDETEDDFISIEVEDHQELKRIDDQIADLVLCLDSTLDTIATIESMYKLFGDNVGHHGTRDAERSAYGPDTVIFALRDQTRHVANTRNKAEALLSKVRNTRTLISSLLERDSGHNLNKQMSALHVLERQGQDESIVMRQLAEKNSRDSSSMRILTMITMIYLPCTIVSNFYSTQFVDQKELPTGGSRLEYASNTYVFFAISVPLTLVTVLIWYLWMNSDALMHLIERKSRRKKDQISLERPKSRLGLRRRQVSGLALSNA